MELVRQKSRVRPVQGTVGTGTKNFRYNGTLYLNPINRYPHRDLYLFRSNFVRLWYLMRL